MILVRRPIESARRFFAHVQQQDLRIVYLFWEAACCGFWLYLPCHGSRWEIVRVVWPVFCCNSRRCFARSRLDVWPTSGTVCHNRSRGKPEALTQCCFNVGPASAIVKTALDVVFAGGESLLIHRLIRKGTDRGDGSIGLYPASRLSARPAGWLAGWAAGWSCLAGSRSSLTSSLHHGRPFPSYVTRWSFFTPFLPAGILPW